MLWFQAVVLTDYSAWLFLVTERCVELVINTSIEFFTSVGWLSLIDF